MAKPKSVSSTLRKCHYERLDVYRWKIHSGNNHFCFNGQCMIGRNLSGVIMVVCIITMTCTIWIIFELPVIIREFSIGILIVIIGLISIVYTYLFLFRSMCMDPGIIPRTNVEEYIDLCKRHPELKTQSAGTMQINIPVKDCILKCKYCVTCKLFRPPRSSHCSICSNCVYLLDHHCPFLELTTREDDKGIYLSIDDQNGQCEHNPFNTKNYLKNLCLKLCTSLPPSLYQAHKKIRLTEQRQTNRV
ncbi:unnamed protein product [Didymodactylos carnosus]|uniref:Palmitoyltransferase n=1 Tax=Didymodactylos carnosus TaxID=1234261 RepID=A0A815H416_9BILA|nr:unnamed protein product [Didymodactylos carnosus]CAF1348946.1 unnamed protein product [Didymodactylos carnosus]CAF3920959.1 unnamed protein product [Didymodactylos carnosus]CAF4217134.1 unnamed protein product [Didymodactylos carnosus]